MTDDTTNPHSGIMDAELFSTLCDFFSRAVVFPGKFDPADGLTHTSAPSRRLSCELENHLKKRGLAIQPIREPYTLLDVDPVFFESLADLKEWGAIDSWGVTEEGLDSILVYTMMGRETYVQPEEVEDTVFALVDGWLAARARSVPAEELAPTERERIARRLGPEKENADG